MEQEGWNYDHAKPNGKNIFLFRDTHHCDVAIQNKLFEAMKEKVERNFFDTLFVEQPFGKKEYSYHGFSDFEEFRNYWIGENKFNSLYAFGYTFCNNENWFSKFRKKKAKVWGVEDTQLKKEKRKLLLEQNKISQGLPLKFLIGEKLKRYLEIEKIMLPLDEERGIKMAENVVQYMEDFKLQNAGFCFGNGHYSEVVDILSKNDLGYVFYSPGRRNVSDLEKSVYRMSFSKNQ